MRNRILTIVIILALVYIVFNLYTKKDVTRENLSMGTIEKNENL